MKKNEHDLSLVSTGITEPSWGKPPLKATKLFVKLIKFRLYDWLWRRYYWYVGNQSINIQAAVVHS